MGDEEPTAEYVVLSDEPIVIPQPRRAVARVAIAYMVAILIVGASAAYIGATVGYDRAAARTDRRIGTLERDLAERRAARNAENATRDAQVRRLRELVCVFADRVQPRDVDVERVRAEFGCTGGPAPGAKPGAMPGAPRDRRSPSPTATAGRTFQPEPAPQPPVTPQPPDPPDEPEPDEPLLCLPIIGCLL